MPAKIGTGSTITFGTSAFSAEITGINGSSNLGREAINIAHLGSTGAIPYIPTTLVEGGEIGLDIHHTGAQNPPSTASAETITIQWGSVTGLTWAFSGFMTDYTPTAPLEDKMTASMTIKVASAITIATGS